MAGVQQTSLVVEFSKAGSIILEQSNKDTEDRPIAYVRVHGYDDHLIATTSGSANRTHTGLRKYTSEFIYFDGSSSFAALRYPNAEQVKISKVGMSYKPEYGVVSNPSFKYDPAKGGVSCANGAVVSLIQVTYQAPYDMWRVNFSGSCPSIEPTPSGGSSDDDDVYIGRDPTVMVAWKEGEIQASLSLEPPPCTYGEEGSTTIGQRQMGAKDQSVVIEVDPKYPVALRAGANPIGVATGSDEATLIGSCKIKVYPGSSDISVTASKGEIYNGAKAVSKTETKKEIITFNGSSTGNMSYPLSNRSVAVKVVGGNFIDQWGRTFTPKVKTNGDSITSVTWITKNRYSDPQTRKVFNTEVSIANLFGVAVPCYGSLEVTYTTSYRSRDYIFKGNSTSRGQVLDFDSTTIIANRGDDAVSLSLDGPDIGGDY